MSRRVLTIDKTLIVSGTEIMETPDGYVCSAEAHVPNFATKPNITITSGAVKTLIALSLSTLLFGCNEAIQVRVSFERLQTETNLVANISGARPNVPLTVGVTGVPRTANMTARGNSDGAGNATIKIAYQYTLDRPKQCDLTPSETSTQGVLLVGDPENPNPNAQTSNPFRFQTTHLFVPCR